MTPADVLPWVAAPLYLYAAGCDLAARIIPDRVPLTLLALGAAAALATDVASLWSALAAGAAVFLALALAGGAVIGGGDVKLAAASVVVLGAGRAIDFILLTALAGGVLALVYLTARGVLRRRPATRADRPMSRHRPGRLLAAEARRIRRGAGLPYGVAIGAAALTLLIQAS